MKPLIAIGWAIASIASIAAATPAAAQDVARGKQLFATCAACHNTQGVSSDAGPSMAGIVGRPSASRDDFRYSRTMSRAGVVWDAAQLDRYLADPQATIPGTRMAFAGMPSATDRADLIAYLATLK